jgi:hypothetical protein
VDRKEHEAGSGMNFLLHEERTLPHPGNLLTNTRP